MHSLGVGKEYRIMESSDPQQIKVDFYETEYDKAYEKKTTFGVYKPIIAGILMIIPAMIVFSFMLYSVIVNYSGWWDILFFGIFSLIELTIIYAGYCAITKQKHRFTLFGAILSFIILINYVPIIGGLAYQFGNINIMVAIVIIALHPFTIIYLIFTSDDEFSS